MFEKIFGIFRKRKKADFSEEIPGDTEEDMFDLGDGSMGTDFDADTISLETGMSNGGFSGSSGGLAESDPEFGDSSGGSEPPMEDELGLGLDLEEGISEEGISAAAEPAVEGPISPPPDIEPEPYVPAREKKSRKGLLVTIVVAVMALVGGFLVATPKSVETIKRAIYTEPTLLEQLEQLQVDNYDLQQKIKPYNEVGSIEEILEIKAEFNKRTEMTAEIKTIEDKIAHRPAAEERRDKNSARLKQTRRVLIVQEGLLANVQKSLKQIEARNDYLLSSTRERVAQMEADSAAAEALRARLETERVNRAEASAIMSREIQEGVERTAFDALSSL